MKLLITTRADNNIKEMTGLTHPIIKDYAKRVGADFKCFTPKMYPVKDEGKYHYRIMETNKLYDDYDRILNLDSDILIMPDCPNLFDVVPEDKIGSIFEDKGSRQNQRRGIIQDIQKKYGDVGWTEGYINTGVFMTSKMHRGIFEPIKVFDSVDMTEEYWSGWGFDDIHLKYNIEKLGLKVHELPFQFNHMTMMSEGWNNNADRFKSYIIHMAGQGKFDKGISSRLEQIKKDKEKIYGA